jgi:hypothetical protein
VTGGSAIQDTPEFVETAKQFRFFDGQPCSGALGFEEQGKTVDYVPGPIFEGGLRVQQSFGDHAREERKAAQVSVRREGRKSQGGGRQRSLRGRRVNVKVAGETLSEELVASLDEGIFFRQAQLKLAAMEVGAASLRARLERKGVEAAQAGGPTGRREPKNGAGDARLRAVEARQAEAIIYPRKLEVGGLEPGFAVSLDEEVMIEQPETMRGG